VRKAQVNRDGYLYVILQQPRRVPVHALVAEAFLGGRPSKFDVNHLNGVKTDNRAANLEYCSRGDNHRHAYQIGLIDRRGVRNGRSRLTQDQVDQIRALRSSGLLPREIGERFGISGQHVGQILLGRKWR
jgi:hypothetical protein